MNTGLLEPALFEPLNDPPGQRADIGAAMPPDFGFVADAAQGHAHEFALHGFGDGLSQRGFAHSRRPHEAEDGALHLGIEFAHAQIFQDAVLDFVETVMFLVQHLFGLS